MKDFRMLSASQQVAEHLREQIFSGHWIEWMPGEGALAEELGIDAKTVGRALRQLDEEGLLDSQGVRRRRRIVLEAESPSARKGALRIALLGAARNHQKSRSLADLPYRLSAAGHQAFYAPRSTVDLGGKPARLAKMVAETRADAWIVFSGSREILEWFAEQPKPVFSVWGRHHGLPVAGAEPDRSPAYAELTRELLALGHKRLVLMARHGQRLPTPGPNEQAFLDELTKHGITVSNYQMPDWEESKKGYHDMLLSLFKLTPPTAIIVDDAALFTVTLQFLAARGLKVPADVSLACTEYDQSFDWCEPEVTHIRWNPDELNECVLKWAKRISAGKRDAGASSCKAWLVSGGTMAPVAKPR